MRRKVHLLVISAILLIGTFSCRHNIYSGFERMENGAYMKIYLHHEDSVKAQPGDVVVFDMIQYTHDSIFFNTYVFEQPIEITLGKSDFEGDVFAALSNMASGDSATLVFLTDSLYEKVWQLDVPAQMSGTAFYSDIKVLEIIPKAVVDARNKEMRARRIENEKAVLEQFAGFRKTESGLIVVSLKGNKKHNKAYESGSMMEVNFVLTDLTNNGDTLVDTYLRDPLLIECDKPYLCQGFDEALSMLSEGASGSFVIPSEIGVDTTIVTPNTVLRADVKVEKRMTKAEYDNYLKEKQMYYERLVQQKMVEEAIRIDEYVRANDIKSNPSENGVYYIENVKGTGNPVGEGDHVQIHYTIYNIEGEKIESSYDFNRPLEFTYGVGEMIDGVEEALRYMRVGGSARLIIPFAMGFGDMDVSEKLPSFSTLVFDMELVDVTQK